jgi:hypothetical protein
MGEPWQWRNDDCEEPWSAEIEMDVFNESEGAVVSIEAKHDGEDTLITPSPAQAREMAAAILRSADAADDHNARHFPALAARPSEEGEQRP